MFVCQPPTTQLNIHLYMSSDSRGVAPFADPGRRVGSELSPNHNEELIIDRSGVTVGGLIKLLEYIALAYGGEGRKIGFMCALVAGAREVSGLS